MKTLLIGMGNPIVTDDAVGILLAREVGAALGPRPDLDVVDECCIGGLNLLDLVTGYDRLVVLDSIKTRGGVPGTWYRFDATDLRETMNLRNVHDANFATAMALGRSLGMRLPDDADVHILAVEIDDNINFGEQLSLPLAAAYDELRDEILAEVRRVLESEAASEAVDDETATAKERVMEMIKLDCPSCGRENQPLTQTEEQLQYRCGACGMVYYGPAKCADDLQPTDVPDTPVEGGGDWDAAPPS